MLGDRRCCHRKQTAGSFGRLRTGSSTLPLAMKLREAPLRMTVFYLAQDDSSFVYPILTEGRYVLSRGAFLARFTGLLGLITFLGLAYAFSTNRRAIRWRTVAWGLGLQILFAFLVLKWSLGQTILRTGSGVITSLLAHSVDGSKIVFGALGVPGSPLAVFAFSVLPTIIF